MNLSFVPLFIFLKKLFVLFCYVFKVLILRLFLRVTHYTFPFQESGEPVGTVVNVFSTAANDLLEVMLDPVKRPGQTGNPKSETGVSGPLVWVPFVEAIVPNVDVNKREMQITPPKGLLELNLRSDERSKKERRQLVRHTLLYFTLITC